MVIICVLLSGLESIFCRLPEILIFNSFGMLLEFLAAPHSSEKCGLNSQPCKSYRYFVVSGDVISKS